ncbi:MAG: alpha/beta hydrolase [Chthonomonas sp.]|nr:alpha/beta hydrolase [Chthonomonas sp.]
MSLIAGAVLAVVFSGSSNSLPSSLEATRAITFATRDRIELKMDVIKSRRSLGGQAAPAILFLHGGAWRDGRRDLPNPIQYELAQRGYVCFQADYRLSQEAPFPAQLHDVRAALNWIKDNAEAWGVDPNRLGVWGMSAGAHLALLTAYSKDALPEKDAKPVRVQAVAAVMPTTDVLEMYRFRLLQRNVRSDLVGQASPEAQLLGGDPEQLKDLAKAASPTSYISSDLPPTWLVHGVKDQTVPAQQSQTLASMLGKAQVRRQLVLLAGLKHEAKWDLFQDGVVTFFQRELGTPSR